MHSHMTEIREMVEKTDLGAKDAMAVIDMLMEDQPSSGEDRTEASPYEAFKELNGLIDKTVKGTSIEKFKPSDTGHPFHSFEIRTEDEDVLGYLNMLYLRKPIPCYYLVYVEVLPSFRGRGLGNMILKAFRDFAESKGAVGLLDNIIPEHDPTYEIYSKLGWECIQDRIGNGEQNRGGNYMIFIPPAMDRNADLDEKLVKLFYNLKKKRPLIDMYDNETMVKHTIDQFQSVYNALVRLFDRDIDSRPDDLLMRFMFTKLATKLLGFQRRIATLLGYTGGESIEQIEISEKIRSLAVQPYSAWGPPDEVPAILGDQQIIRTLPEALMDNPTAVVETLPLYKRPYLTSMIEKNHLEPSNFKIDDLLRFGFDPTRLREFEHDGVEYIFERISPRFLRNVQRRLESLPRIERLAKDKNFGRARLSVNPPIAIFRHRSNVYVLRRKVEGVHLEEALDQLKTAEHLKHMNQTAKIDRTIIKTVKAVKEWLSGRLDAEEDLESLSFFIPWNLERNIPNVSVDIASVCLDKVWIA